MFSKILMGQEKQSPFAKLMSILLIGMGIFFGMYAFFANATVWDINGNSWDNSNYITSDFWTYSPSTGDIIGALYGSDSGDITAYTLNRTGNICDYNNLTVKFLYPGLDTISQQLSGNTIYILNSGDYRISYSNGIKMNDCTTVIGSGKATIYSTNTMVERGIIDSSEKQNSIIDNISIDGEFDGNGIHHIKNNYGIFLRIGMNNNIHNVHIYNNNYGIYLSDISNSIINNSQSYNNYYGLSSNSGSNNSIINSQFYNNTNGLHLQNTSHNNINNSHTYNNTDAGIAFNNSTQNTINNSQVHNNTNGIYLFNGSLNNAINNSQIYNNLGIGMALFNSTNTIIHNSQFYNNKNAGIWINTSTGNVYYDTLSFFGNGSNIIGPSTSITGGHSYDSIVSLIGRGDGILHTSGLMSRDYITNPVNQNGSYLLPRGVSFTGLMINNSLYTIKSIGYSYGSGILTQKQAVIYSGNNIITGGVFDSTKYIGSDTIKRTGDLIGLSSNMNSNTISLMGISTTTSQYSLFGDITSYIYGQNINIATGVILLGGSGVKTIITQLYSGTNFATHFARTGYLNTTPSDTTPPVVSSGYIYIGTTGNNGNTGYYKGTVDIRANVSDNNGVSGSSCEYTINNGTHRYMGMYTGTSTTGYCYQSNIFGELNLNINFRVKDLSGNQGTGTAKLYVYDGTAPTFTFANNSGFECTNGMLNITNPNDIGIGLHSAAYSFDGNTRNSTTTIPINAQQPGTQNKTGWIRDVFLNSGYLVATYTFINTGITANNFTGSTNVENSSKTANWKVLSNVAEGGCGSGDISYSGIVIQGTKGTCTTNGSIITYTPTTNQTGSDTCTIQVKDNENSTKNIIVTWTGINTTLPCGNGTIEAGEQCDPATSTGRACTSNCVLIVPSCTGFSFAPDNGSTSLHVTFIALGQIGIQQSFNIKKGIQNYRTQQGGTGGLGFSVPITLSNTGIYDVIFTGSNPFSGDLTCTHTGTITVNAIESVPPTISTAYIYSGTTGNNGTTGYYKGTVDIQANVTDTGGISGSTCEYTTGGISWLSANYSGIGNTGYCYQSNIIGGLNLNINFRVKDLSGNQGTGTAKLYVYDGTAPTFTFANNSGFECTNGMLNITNPNDIGIGLHSAAYSFDGNTRNSTTTIPINAQQPGTQNKTGWIRDAFLNSGYLVATYTFINTGITANNFTGSTNVSDTLKTGDWIASSFASEGNCGTGNLSYSGIVIQGSKGVCSVSGTIITYMPYLGQMGGDTCTIQIQDNENSTRNIIVTWTGINTPNYSFTGYTLTGGTVTSGNYYNTGIYINFTGTNLSGATLNSLPYLIGNIITTGGSYTFVLSDIGGNTTGMTFTIDTTKPSVTGTAPDSGTTISTTNAITFSWTGLDANMSGYTVFITGTQIQNITTTGTNVTGTLTNGTYTRYVIATDRAGNTGVSVPATFTFVTPLIPTMTLLTGNLQSNTTGRYTKNYVSISLRTNKAANYSFTGDFTTPTPPVLGTGLNGLMTTGTFTLTTGDGQKNIYLSVTDGITTTGKIFTTYLDTTAPSIVTLTSPSSGAAATGAFTLNRSAASDTGVGMSGYQYFVSTTGTIGVGIVTSGFTTNAYKSFANGEIGTSGTFYRYIKSIDKLSNSGTSISQPFSYTGTLDTTPDQFTLNTLTDVLLDRIYGSNTITIAGLSANTPVLASINRGVLYISGNMVGTTGYVQNGWTVKIELVSSRDYDTQVTSTLTIGGVTSTFSITTETEESATETTSTSILSITAKLQIVAIFQSLRDMYSGIKQSEFLNSLLIMLQSKIDDLGTSSSNNNARASLQYLYNLVDNYREDIGTTTDISGIGDIVNGIYTAPNGKKYTITYNSTTKQFTSPNFLTPKYFTTWDSFKFVIDMNNPAGSSYLTGKAIKARRGKILIDGTWQTSTYTAPNHKVFYFFKTMEGKYSSYTFTSERYFDSLEAVKEFIYYNTKK